MDATQIVELIGKNQTAQLIILGVFVAMFILDKARYYFGRKEKNGRDAEQLAQLLIEKFNNVNHEDDTKFVPGFSPTCKTHGEAITKVETEIPHIKQGLDDVKKAVASNASKASENFKETFKLLREIKNGGK